MELRHLRYFVAVAEELHFGRAAERMGIAQPPLSQQIQKLELELGTQLFFRTKRKVSLTEAGEALFRRARDILKSVEKATLEAQCVGRGEMGHLVVSYMSSAMLGKFPMILQGFKKDYPDVNVELVQMTSNEQLHGLAAGQIDAGFASIKDEPAKFEIEGACLRAEKIWEEELLVALNPAHPLAAKSVLALRALAQQPFVSLERLPVNGYFDQLLELCQGVGFTPAVVKEAVELPAVLAYVAAGTGIAIIPACACPAWSETLTFVPLRQKPTIGVTLVWRHDNLSPAFNAFRKCVRKIMNTSG